MSCFLVYVAVLGLSAWAVIFHDGQLRRQDIHYPEGLPQKVAAYTLIGTGVLFAFLWLSDVVPALLTGRVPASLTEAGLWVNPIHVIDLSMVLPGSSSAASRGSGVGRTACSGWHRGSSSPC